jgi:hypothetical protein
MGHFPYYYNLKVIDQMIKVQEETTNKIEESLESFPNTE